MMLMMGMMDRMLVILTKNMICMKNMVKMNNMVCVCVCVCVCHVHQVSPGSDFVNGQEGLPGPQLQPPEPLRVPPPHSALFRVVLT